MLTSTIIEHKTLIGIMEQYIDDDNPKVGIFWYDEDNNELFGVESCDASSVRLSNGIGTIGKLHQNYWKKQHYRAVAKNDVESIYFQETNYTMIPRGRVFVDNGKFKVYVGSWINDVADKLRTLIEEEFSLFDGFEFIIDSHWELGHGWSEHNFNFDAQP